MSPAIVQPAINGHTIPAFRDLTHHLSEETRLRLPNMMKDMSRLVMSRENMITLANGEPDVALYPIRDVQFRTAYVKERDPVSALLNGSPCFDTLGSDPSGRGLSVVDALAYGPAEGLKPVLEVIQKFVDVFHSPRNHVVTLHLGNADGVTKLFRLFGDRGDTFLADELTFSALTVAAIPHGVKWLPVRLDEGGMIPDDLEHILKTWDLQPHAGRRPHVLYTIPCGQNPTGSTLDLKRRKQIYRIAQEWDLIIVEDDPYYFLQFDRPELDPLDPDFLKNFARSLVPSFLSMDVDGRVVRSDSFSKIIAPGLRLGMFTTTRKFQEHLVKLIDNSTQQPAGLSQLVIMELLGEQGWKMEGFARWVDSICKEYQRRRDHFIDVFDRMIAPTGYATVSRPQAGMFVWIEIHLERHPRYRTEQRSGHADVDQATPRTNCVQLMQEIFWECIEAGVALILADNFLVSRDPEALTRHDVHMQDRMNYFRATFAGSYEKMNEGITIFEKVLRRFFSNEEMSGNKIDDVTSPSLILNRGEVLKV